MTQIAQIDFSLDPDGDGDGLVQAAIDAGEPFAVGGFECIPQLNAWWVLIMDTQERVYDYELSGKELFNLIQHGRPDRL